MKKPTKKYLKDTIASSYNYGEEGARVRKEAINELISVTKKPVSKKKVFKGFPPLEVSDEKPHLTTQKELNKQLDDLYININMKKTIKKPINKNAVILSGSFNKEQIESFKTIDEIRKCLNLEGEFPHDKFFSRKDLGDHKKSEMWYTSKTNLTIILWTIIGVIAGLLVCHLQQIECINFGCK
jgi:hypothetical protein